LVSGKPLADKAQTEPVSTSGLSESTCVRVIDGQLYRVVYRLEVRATAYTAGPESTGKLPGDPAYGVTASGTTVEEGHTIAVDPQRIPLGSQVFIPGRGLYVAEDTGRAIVGARVDIYMDDLADALAFGVRRLPLEIVRPVDLYSKVWHVVAPRVAK